MGAFLAGLVSFLGSDAGQTLLAVIVAALFGKYLKGNKRAETVARLWQEAFAAAEKMGLLEKLPGSKKWLAAVKFVNDALLAAGMPILTGPEMAAGEKAAERFGWVNKNVNAALAAELAKLPE